MRDRARAGRFAFVHDRGVDFAAGVWVVDPAFILDLTVDALNHDEDDTGPAREEAFFAGAGLTDDELQHAADDDRARKQQAKLRHAEATRRNLGLGHDISAGLIEPTPGQLQASRRSSATCSPSTTATSSPTAPAGRTRSAGARVDPPPRTPPPDTILDAELEDAFEDPEPLRGIASSSPAGPPPSSSTPTASPRPKALGSGRMSRKLATPSPRRTARCAPASGSSCGRSSPPPSPP